MVQMDEIIRDTDQQASFENYMGLFADEVAAHGLLESGPANIDDLRAHYTPVFFELKDGVLLSDEVIVAGAMAAQRYHSLLYLHGEFDGIKADHLPVFLRGQTFFRFDQTGRIIERWSNHDHAFRLQQLKGTEGRVGGEKLAAILNGSGLSENEVRQRIAALNDAFNYVQSPAERRERFLRFFAPDVVVHGIAEDSVGRRALFDYYDGLWNAFPDMEQTIEAALTAWSHGAIRWRGLGSHRAPYRGHAPTMRPVKMRGEMIMRFGDSGKIDEVWIYDRVSQQF